MRKLKKFSFRLEPVLKYKNDRLEVLKNEHAKIVNKIMKQEEKIKELENTSGDSSYWSNQLSELFGQAELYHKKGIYSFKKN